MIDLLVELISAPRMASSAFYDGCGNVLFYSAGDHQLDDYLESIEFSLTGKARWIAWKDKDTWMMPAGEVIRLAATITAQGKES